MFSSLLWVFIKSRLIFKTETPPLYSHEMHMQSWLECMCTVHFRALFTVAIHRMRKVQNAKKVKQLKNGR